MASAGASTTVIYDTPSKDGITWSFNTIRVLYFLYYKGIPYSIKNIEYPEINSTFEATSLKPKDDPQEPYGVPVLEFQESSGTTEYAQNIVRIIEALERIQLDPSLRHLSPRSVEFRGLYGPILDTITAALTGQTAGILSKQSAEIFVQNHEAKHGASVEQWAKEHTLSEALEKVEPDFRKVGDWIEQVPGPFVHGDHAAYADFTIAATLGSVRAAGFEDEFKKLLNVHPAVRILYEAVGELQRGNKGVETLFQ